MTPGDTEGRPDLGTVLTEYQVESEAVVTFVPDVTVGVWPLTVEVDVPFINGVRVTETEAQMLDRLSLNELRIGNNIRTTAQVESNERFPNQPVPDHIAGLDPDDVATWQGNDGHRDAFRHAYWNALQTRQFGAEWTEQFATAHEGRPDNPMDREAMDLYNNEVGRNIAIAHPDATEAELADLVMQAMENGELIVIDADGELAWSDQVQVGQHGLADDPVGTGGAPCPMATLTPRVEPGRA